MHHQGLVPDVITYSAAISACEKGKQPRHAVHILQDMQGYGITPDVMPYFATDACEEVQKPQRIWRAKLSKASDLSQDMYCRSISARGEGLEPKRIWRDARYHRPARPTAQGARAVLNVVSSVDSEEEPPTT